MQQPLIRVGLLDKKRFISGCLIGHCLLENGVSVTGPFQATAADGRIRLVFPEMNLCVSAPVAVIQTMEKSVVMLHGVTIGADFHWQRDRDLAYAGRIDFFPRESDTVAAVNVLPLEEYLVSVISSEMNANAPVEFLKAHAVVSRSWLMAALRRTVAGNVQDVTERTEPSVRTRHVRWYEREDHDGYDVCADDHCQRYRGTGEFLSGGAAEAVRSTAGLFLVADGEICDARYSKACGGRTERFETAWADTAVPYLQSVCDAPEEIAPPQNEEEVRKWLIERPAAYCNMASESLLSRVLNASDRPTTDFFRWRVTYERAELEEILRKKSGIDFGRLLEVEPLKRGPSGRIWLLRISGTEQTATVGKELEIRRWLSPSHLYSSAFVMDTERNAAGTPLRFIFHGGGWGHGVGFCQIGAAAMADEGISAERILSHYFRGAELRKMY